MQVIDGTVGSGGHALEILKVIGPHGRLIAVDQDPAAIARCREILKNFPQVSLHTGNFLHLENILDPLNLQAVDAVILDVGLSSDQLEDAHRGFSFGKEGPLDMRMNPEVPLSAQDLVNDLSQEALEKIFFDYGEERRAKRFAREIVSGRRRKSIETTGELVGLLERVLPRGFSAAKGQRPIWARRHPATRVFQALRIAVNDELGVLQRGLPKIWGRVRVGGRMAVMTFHSLEDRIVKNHFRDWCRAGEALAVTKKPIIPMRQEVLANPRSRSAKLRTVEKSHASMEPR